MIKSFVSASLLAGLLACGSKAAPTTTPPVDEPIVAPSPPPYASLFEFGASWTFQIEEIGTNSYRKSVQETCKVARVGTFDGGKYAEITCGDKWPSKPEDGWDTLGGVWAATDAGLWHVPNVASWPSDGVVPELLVQDMVLAASPVAGTRPGYNGTTVVIAREGDAWCWTDSAAKASDFLVSICVGPDGPTEGGWAFDTWSVGFARATAAQLEQAAGPPPCGAPAAGLIAELTGDCTPASVTGSFGSVEGRHGMAYSFDGISEYLSVPLAQIGTSFTIAAWVWWDTIADGTVLSRGVSMEDGLYVKVCCDGTLLASFSTSEGLYGDEISPGVWTHLALAVDDGEAKLYLAGKYQGSTYSGTEAVGSRITFGAMAIVEESEPDTGFFAGKLDDVQVFDRALDFDEVEALAAP